MRPTREVATNNGQTYFVTSNTAQRRPFFPHARWAELFIKTLYGYRPERFLIHGFAVMPDHFHVLITPKESLERAVQYIKGGFSFRAKKELGWNGDVWSRDFPIIGFGMKRISRCISGISRGIQSKPDWQSEGKTIRIVLRTVCLSWTHSLRG
jgi:REP element-mobilizing transposase RayT